MPGMTTVGKGDKPAYIPVQKHDQLLQTKMDNLSQLEV